MFAVTVPHALLRLGLAIAMGSAIGYDREQKNRPAGMRTHVLVCIGACVIAMIQQEIASQAIEFAKDNLEIATVIRSDQARLIAQVVSGVGFLGAGTIIVTHHSIRGLTTAASLWATAGLGLAVGMGYYQIALLSFVAVLLVLVFLKKIIHVNVHQRLQIKYRNKNATKTFLKNYFAQHGITVDDLDFIVEQSTDGPVYRSVYVLHVPRGFKYPQMIEDLSLNDDILSIRTVTV